MPFHVGEDGYDLAGFIQPPDELVVTLVFRGVMLAEGSMDISVADDLVPEMLEDPQHHQVICSRIVARRLNDKIKLWVIGITRD